MKHIYEAMDRWTKAILTRAKFAKFFDSDPQHAIEHVNGKLDEASRAEERRAAFLSAVEA